MTRAIRTHLGDFVSLVVLSLIAVATIAYIVAHQASRPALPWEAQPFTLRGEFSTAQAVTPGQGQSIRVAGVQVGTITRVDLRNGVAVVTTQIDPKWVSRLRLRSDATMLLRPRTGLKDMFIELDPGKSGTPIRSGFTVPVANTAPDVNPDEFLSALDGDTRQYLELLINGGGKGLQGHGSDVNALYKTLGPTLADLKQVTQAIAQRRSDLRQLVHGYADLTNDLANSDQQVQTLVRASDQVFRAFAAQNQNLGSAVSKLPGTLHTTQGTLARVNGFAPLLAATLCNANGAQASAGNCNSDSLTPSFVQIERTNPLVKSFAQSAFKPTRTQIRPFVQVARPYVRELRPTAINLSNATPDLNASFQELNRFFDMLAYNPQGRVPVTGNSAQDAKRDQGYLFWLAWVAENGASVFSTSDAQGPFRRIYLGFDCTTLKLVSQLEPAFVNGTGLANALNDPRLCPGSSAGSVLPPLPGLPGIIPLSRRSNAGLPARNARPPASAHTATRTAR